jgi:predicted small lipoprotein YifL
LNRFCDRTFLRLALICVAVASLGLAACGRKGPLDLPPGGSFAGEPQASVPARTSGPMVLPIGGQAKNNEPGVGPDGRPQAPKGPNKRIFLDGLLD